MAARDLQYFVKNFGCRATQADGASIEQYLATRGLSPAPNAAEADVVVFNSCTVTAAADADLRASVRQVHRANPNTKILVTGCYAQRAPEEVAALPGVTWVVDNSQKHRVGEVALSGFGDSSFVRLSEVGGAQYTGDIFAHTLLLAAPVFDGPEHNGARTRPNLKVQDGCDNRCSFCVIPLVRGQSRSLALDSVLTEMNQLVDAGYKEVVISGINLGRWGRDLAQPSRFENLVHAILDCTSLERLRISSVEPMDWTPELIQLVAESPRICKHAHVPLQSGSDRVLRMMHRKYRPWHYAERINAIRAAMPDAALGADVMVGFPGETEELFEENRAFIASLPFTYLHVFTYSSRPGTAAASMSDHVPVHIARERNKILRDLVAEKNAAFRESFVGRELEAITLHSNPGGTTEALTNNFLKLRLSGDHQPNQLLNIQVRGLTTDGLVGEKVVTSRLIEVCV
jgi:threonylcarbamoyladenosine tRNA methylthiotransferase MtaB